VLIQSPEARMDRLVLPLGAWIGGRYPIKNVLGVEVDTVYLTLCLCRISLDGVREWEGGLSSDGELEMNTHWAHVFCSAIKQCVFGVTDVNRVVVYFCGLQNTVRFGSARASEIVEGVKGKLRFVDKGSRGNNIWNNMPWYAEREDVPLEKFEHRKEGEVTRYRLTFTETKYTPEKTVIVEFYDSITECGKGCALE
jgi:hypothetical protein